ncbi:(2Fe-2S)-binding protein [Brenneria izadpanahii]|uniref:(2Fe-2S)-binding protein n=1 Tax=Brenneria izadpanahii TaxID=2722756 RepID=A0ABX7UPQ2_9GAMM|nr:(2Fe-2S)-binding protein [Brenneria izadpanahii]QTF07554.1 (2Fe-2S)-binding protein [Brenneria izadpanahii]
MPKRIENMDTVVTFTFEGQTVRAQAGDSVAAALVGANLRSLRDSVVSGAPRGVFCMMGTCFDCLVEIEGVANRQACMTPVREGMNVRRQRVYEQVK